MQNLSTQEKIEAIRQACIRVNPEIVELKFGCHLLRKNRNGKNLGVFVEWAGSMLAVIHWYGNERANTEVAEFYKIIGRKITLPDVLLAIPKWSNEKMESLAILGFDYGNPNVVLIMDSKHTHPRAEWNLLKPLEEQEEPTIDFIHDLLK